MSEGVGRKQGIILLGTSHVVRALEPAPHVKTR